MKEILFNKLRCGAKFLLTPVILSMGLSFVTACDARDVAKQASYPDSQQTKIINRIINMLNWPEEVKQLETFHSCILSDEVNTPYWQHLKNVSYQNKPTDVTKIATPSQAKEKCQLLFVHLKDEQTLKDTIHQLHGQRILLISDMDGFANKGGHMNFHMVNEQMGVTINTLTVNDSGFDFDLSRFNNITIIPGSKEVKE